METVLVTILGVVSVIALRLIGEEASGWLRVGAEALVRRTTHKLPPAIQSRYLEEWTAELSAYPAPLGKLWYAASLYFVGGRHMARECHAAEREQVAAARRLNVEVAPTSVVPLLLPDGTKIDVGPEQSSQLMYLFASFIRRSATSAANRGPEGSRVARFADAAAAVLSIRVLARAVSVLLRAHYLATDEVVKVVEKLGRSALRLLQRFRH